MLTIFLCAGCGRIGYDLLALGDGGSGPGTGGAGGAPLTGTGGSAAGTGGSAAGTGGSPGTGGVQDASGETLGAADAPPPNTTCSQAGTQTQVWSFDTDVQGWQLSGPGTMVWTGAVGDPAPGAIEVDWSGTTHPRLIQAFGDLRGHIITAEVWVDAGVTVTAKLFVQTGTKWVWADGGIVTPKGGQWTCLALDIDNPAFSKNQYDPTNVAIIGLELGDNGTNRIYFDQFGY
jgi:hypothetical protein